MDFRKEITFAADADSVYALLGEERFRREVAERAGATSIEVAEEQSAAGRTSMVQTSQPADFLPGAARRVLGDELRVRQVETWRTPTEADLEVTIPGQPGQIRGTVTLREEGGRTIQVVDAVAKAKIPLVGGKIEAVICRALGSVLKLQEQVAAERLGSGAASG